MTTLTEGRTYQIHTPETTEPITAKVLMVDRDSAGNPAQVWLDSPEPERPMLLVLTGGMTFTEVDTGELKATYTVRDLGQDDRSAEEIVAEATEARGEGVAVGPADKILPRKD